MFLGRLVARGGVRMLRSPRVRVVCLSDVGESRRDRAEHRKSRESFVNGSKRMRQIFRAPLLSRFF